MHPTTIRLPEDKLARLDALAKTMRRSRNEALNEAIDNYLEYHEWFLTSVEEGLRAIKEGRVVSHEQVMERLRKYGIED